MAGREGYHLHRASAWRPNSRQRRVLDAVAEGRTNAEIAEALGITLDGAKWHVSELLRETGQQSREDLARWWREQRQRRAFAALPLTSAKPALALAALLLAIVVPLVALRAIDDGSVGNGAPANDDAVGLDLPPTSTPLPLPTAVPTLTAMAPVPYATAYYACPVTKPNGNTPPGEGTSPTHHGNGVIWTTLSEDGRMLFGPDIPGFPMATEGTANNDGSVSTKWVWFTTVRDPAGPYRGTFSLDAQRLDGPGTLVGEFTPGISGISGLPVWVGGPRFSNEGCWRLTAQIGDASLTVVVYLQVVR